MKHNSVVDIEFFRKGFHDLGISKRADYEDNTWTPKVDKPRGFVGRLWDAGKAMLPWTDTVKLKGNLNLRPWLTDSQDRTALTQAQKDWWNKQDGSQLMAYRPTNQRQWQIWKNTNNFARQQSIENVNSYADHLTKIRNNTMAGLKWTEDDEAEYRLKMQALGRTVVNDNSYVDAQGSYAYANKRRQQLHDRAQKVLPHAAMKALKPLQFVPFLGRIPTKAEQAQREMEQLAYDPRTGKIDQNAEGVGVSANKLVGAHRAISGVGAAIPWVALGKPMGGISGYLDVVQGTGQILQNNTQDLSNAGIGGIRNSFPGQLAESILSTGAVMGVAEKLYSMPGYGFALNPVRGIAGKVTGKLAPVALKQGAPRVAKWAHGLTSWLAGTSAPTIRTTAYSISKAPTLLGKANAALHVGGTNAMNAASVAHHTLGSFIGSQAASVALYGALGSGAKLATEALTKDKQTGTGSFMDNLTSGAYHWATSGHTGEYGGLGTHVGDRVVQLARKLEKEHMDANPDYTPEYTQEYAGGGIMPSHRFLEQARAQMLEERTADLTQKLDTLFADTADPAKTSAEAANAIIANYTNTKWTGIDFDIAKYVQDTRVNDADAQRIVMAIARNELQFAGLATDAFRGKYDKIADKLYGNDPKYIHARSRMNELVGASIGRMVKSGNMNMEGGVPDAFKAFARKMTTEDLSAAVLPAITGEGIGLDKLMSMRNMLKSDIDSGFSESQRTFIADAAFASALTNSSAEEVGRNVPAMVGLMKDSGNNHLVSKHGQEAAAEIIRIVSSDKQYAQELFGGLPPEYLDKLTKDIGEGGIAALGDNPIAKQVFTNKHILAGAMEHLPREKVWALLAKASAEPEGELTQEDMARRNAMAGAAKIWAWNRAKEDPINNIPKLLKLTKLGDTKFGETLVDNPIAFWALAVLAIIGGGALLGSIFKGIGGMVESVFSGEDATVNEDDYAYGRYR
jgi:hypothetical protein